MSEAGTGAPPQVFVVDSQANYIPMPSGRKSKWSQEVMKILLLLLGLCILGLMVEGYLIYKVYQRTDALSLIPPCQNSSTPSEHQGGTISRQLGPEESNEIPPLLTNKQRKPFAHLVGCSSPDKWVDNVVKWEMVGEAETHKIKYESGQLIIEEDGIYYLYSKLELNVAHECDVIFHNMMKKTDAYDDPINLLRSKSNRCFRSKPSSSNGEDLRSSFLAGIYHLMKGDKIFVTLNKTEHLNLGSYENFMGAFMISQ